MLSHPTWQMAIENGHSESRPRGECVYLILFALSQALALPCRLAADLLAGPCFGRLEPEEHLTGAGDTSTGCILIPLYSYIQKNMFCP